ncbi:MAG TPA: YfhO family protein, partial [Polyangia bacterium]
LDDVAAPCAIASSRPEAVELACAAPAAGYAVLLDAYAAGWRATVDGAAAPIVRADAVVRAVPIAAGAHTIALRYRTPGLRAGALASLLAWLAWLGVALRLRSA